MNSAEKLKKAAAVTAVAAAASASLLVNGLVEDPSSLLEEPATPLCAALNTDGEDASDGGAAADEEERASLRSRLRQWLLELPVGVRAGVLVPLWGAGWALCAVLELLWSQVLSPVAGTAAGWLAAAGALTGAVAVAAKALFPQLPLKKLLRPRSFLMLLIAVGLLGAADGVLALTWESYESWRLLLRGGGTLALGGAALWRVFRRGRRMEAERAVEAADEEPLALRQERALREVLEMADSVK